MNLNRPFQSITPTVDGDVLTAMSSAEEIAFTPGQLHRVLNRHSEEGIRKVLRRLDVQGTVLSSKVGNAYAYRLNREHLAYNHVIGLARMFTVFLERLESTMTGWETPPVYSALFGSAARGSMTSDSDIDIFLVRPNLVDGDLWDSQVASLTADVTSWTGNDARDLQFTEQEIIRVGAAEPVLMDVVREGLTIVGSRTAFVRLLRQGDA
ncbi:nucleotidyltransferase domain-containing protein [Rhodococcus sp. NPDC056516]|uniref:nucleotidyltransferase domain-containing protein n=1 Tax=Rhodococcus sp. NPDC056516 TaxID=3345847 RepID=UPI00366D61C3